MSSYNSILYDAAGKDNSEHLIKIIREYFDDLDTPNPDMANMTPMHNAAKNGKSQNIKILVAFNSTSIDAVDKYGRTPLHLAVLHKHVGAVNTLLKRGSNGMNYIDTNGRTPLFYAAHYCYPNIVRKLLETDQLSIDQPDIFGDTPIFTATSSGCNDNIKILMEFGCKSIDVRCRQNLTPLNLAAKKGYSSTIETLVRMKSKSINQPIDVEGHSPLYNALVNGHYGAAKVLMALGANRKISTFGLNTDAIKTLVIGPTDEEIINIRKKVYFDDLLYVVLVNTL